MWESMRVCGTSTWQLPSDCCRPMHLLQVILSCFNLRRSLVELGKDGADGEKLVELLAGAGGAEGDDQEEGVPGGGDGLLVALSRSMLQTVLGIEADTAVAVMYQRQQAGGH